MAKLVNHQLPCQLVTGLYFMTGMISRLYCMLPGSSFFLKWWSEFRKENAVDTSWKNVIWNNQEIRINNKPDFYKRYFNHRIQTAGDLRFDLNNIDCFELFVKHIEKTNVLEWIGLRHSVPIDLRNAYYIPDCTDLKLTVAFQSMLLK